DANRIHCGRKTRVVSMFGRWRSVKSSAAFFVLGVMAGAILSPASALVISPTYDTTVTSSPQKNQIEAAFGTVISQYEALFSNNVTVTVSLQLQAGSFLGENSPFIAPLTYTQFRTALGTAGAGGNGPAQTEFATLPNQTNAPGPAATSNVEVTTPAARALGFSGSGFNPPPGQVDSQILITTSFPVQYARVD